MSDAKGDGDATTRRSLAQERVTLYAFQVEIAEIIEHRRARLSAANGDDLVSCSELIAAFFTALHASKMPSP